MTEITVAALQLAFSSDIDANIAHVSDLVRGIQSRPHLGHVDGECLEDVRGSTVAQGLPRRLSSFARPAPEDHASVARVRQLIGGLESNSRICPCY